MHSKPALSVRAENAQRWAFLLFGNCFLDRLSPLRGWMHSKPALSAREENDQRCALFDVYGWNEKLRRSLNGCSRSKIGEYYWMEYTLWN